MADNFDTGIEYQEGEIRVSVRGLVEFILRHGDIDNRHQISPDNAMQEGGRIHRMIQRRMGADYQAEVSLRYTHPAKGYRLVVEGRADGILHQNGQIIIDEIKGTYRDLVKMKEPASLHLAQAKCYAYMYALKEELKEITVRITYCNMETEDIRYFHEDYTFEELQQWFVRLIENYKRWSDFVWRWRGIRQNSIQEMRFPFEYRPGQKDLIENVYKTIYHKKKLFLEASTGVGKTISTLYPAISAMGRGMSERIFYLTAKTITRTVAEDTLHLLREQGLRMKSVILTAKEKICFMEETECNPEHCPYAKGHYDRINDAVYDLLTSEEAFTREKIVEYAQKHQVCPFEMCLDMSLYSDVVIGDYNYLFDPHVYLKRFFAEGGGGDYIFLIDEAHNLLERGREMYSATLWKEQFLELSTKIKATILSENTKKSRKKGISGQIALEMTGVEQPLSERGGQLISAAESEEGSQLDGEQSGGYKRSILVGKGYGEKIKYQLDKCNKELLQMKRECENYRIITEMDSFVRWLMKLHGTMDEYLSEQEVALPVRDDILEFYFEIGHFLQTYELLDENYVNYTQIEEDGRFMIRLFCVDPAQNLKQCMAKGRSSILFSATLLPIQYYKKLLGGEEGDYEIYATSIFRPEKKALLIANDVTSKFTRRTEEEYEKIATYIEEIVKNRHGNYLVFCPSFAFMRKIYDIYVERFGSVRQCILQEETMSESQRESFLSRFREIADENGVNITSERYLIGFCTLGGIFSEGIDLKNDSLIGAIVVGTGLPQVCNEREILMKYFDEEGGYGFDYAYRYPGMNKVLQAAGRVIRTEEDIGVVALLDERFLQYAYQKLFPREWNTYEMVSVTTVAKKIERFWDEWL